MEKDFDQFAESYRDAHTKNIHTISGADSYYFAEYKVKEVTRFEKDIPMSLLDVGCGDGITAMYFEKYFSSISVTGIDVSQKSIKEAQKLELKHSNFFVYSGEKLPFNDNSFDCVFMACVLHHVNEWEQLKLLKEILRVLKPEGKFYLFEHNPYNPLTKCLVNSCPFDRGVKLLTDKYCKQLLKKSGFIIKNRHFTLFFPIKKSFMFFRKLEFYLRFLPIGGQYYYRSVKKLS